MTNEGVERAAASLSARRPPSGRSLPGRVDLVRVLFVPAFERSAGGVAGRGTDVLIVNAQELLR